MTYFFPIAAIMQSQKNYRFSPLFTLTLYGVAAMFFIRFCKCEGLQHLVLKLRKEASKTWERDAALE